MRLRMLTIPVIGALLVAAARPAAFRVPGAGVDADPKSDAATVTSTNLVTVKAGDYFFEAPATIPAGMTTFRLVTTGKEMHHATIFRLDGGHTVSQLLDAMKGHGPLPSWAVAMGGPNAPTPGSSFDATLDMKPGNYALVCFIPSPDGAPHVMKGMSRALTVTGKGAGSAPKADITMRLDDYAFATTPAITAGRHTIRVENGAKQSHEVEIVRLAPGKSAHDVLAWIEKMDGPPPGAPVGGVTFLAPSGVNYIDADFTPGRYALICFVPDAKDGKPHFVHGMVTEIEVK